MYEFDQRIDRRQTGSLKWDKYKARDIVPLWVADMDFVSAPEILHALQARLAHGIFGYTVPYENVIAAVTNYLQRAHGYKIEADWLVWMPGLVPALNVAALAYAAPGEAILTCTPVYPPFLTAPIWRERQLITSHLRRKGTRWTFDFDDLAAKVTTKTRAFILCNPHNPVGRAYEREELERLAHFCQQHDLVLCSDEIHCDLVYPGFKHISTATLSPEVADRTVTFMAPSKTYNLPGLACSFLVIANPHLRARFKKAARGLITEVNALGYAGCAAAYDHGENWRQALLRYLTRNRDHLYAFVQQKLPGVEMLPMEATYLAWLNVKDLGLESPVAFFEDAGVGLSNGADFGDGDYVRLNFGCPRSQLDEGLARMEHAVQGLS